MIDALSSGNSVFEMSVSKKALILQFLKGVTGFGGFALISQAGAFFLIPIYWHYLGPADYGVIGVYAIVVNVLSALFTFGLNGTVERYYYEWGEHERLLKIRVLWYFQIALMVVFSFIVHFVFLCKIVEFKSASYSSVIFFAIMTSSFLSFQYIPFGILRVAQKIKLFGVLSLLSFFLTSLMTIFFLAYADAGVEGYFCAQVIASGLMALLWIYVLDKNSTNGGWVSVFEELKFAAPNLPLTAIARMSQVVDKIILERFLSLSSFGLYVVANRFGGYFGSVNSVLKLAFYPVIFKNIIKDNGSPENVSQLSLFYVLLFAQLGLVVMVFFEGFVFWFGENKFYGSFDYIPYFVIVAFINGLATAFGVGIELAKVPHKALYAVIPSSATAIVLAIVLVPAMGVYGGITALIVSASVRSAILIYLGHKAYPRSFPVGKLCLILSVDAIMVWGICFFRIDTFGEIVFKLIILLVISLILVFTIYREQVVSFFGNVYQRC